MSLIPLVIGGVEIPLLAGVGIDQRYDPVAAVARHRMGEGSLRQQTAWTGKLATTIAGRGNIPPGIQHLDYTAQMVIKCMAYRAYTSTSNQMTLPAARRSDIAPKGVALMANGKFVRTPVNMAGDLATLTQVTGAAQYQCLYLPELTVFADPPREQKPRRGSEFSWVLTAEEV